MPDEITYQVVVNQENLYSVWPVFMEIPRGWEPTGKKGAKQECLDHIKGIWVDMRPLNLRQAMLSV